jgi:hypothetical protein
MARSAGATHFLTCALPCTLAPMASAPRPHQSQTPQQTTSLTPCTNKVPRFSLKKICRGPEGKSHDPRDKHGLRADVERKSRLDPVVKSLRSPGVADRARTGVGLRVRTELAIKLGEQREQTAAPNCAKPLNCWLDTRLPSNCMPPYWLASQPPNDWMQR